MGLRESRLGWDDVQLSAARQFKISSILAIKNGSLFSSRLVKEAFDALHDNPSRVGTDGF